MVILSGLIRYTHIHTHTLSLSLYLSLPLCLSIALCLVQTASPLSPSPPPHTLFHPPATHLCTHPTHTAVHMSIHSIKSWSVSYKRHQQYSTSDKHQKQHVLVCFGCVSYVVSPLSQYASLTTNNTHSMLLETYVVSPTTQYFQRTPTTQHSRQTPKESERCVSY